MFGVFRVKNHDFTQTNNFFPILGGRNNYIIVKKKTRNIYIYEN
jgi:hypothetical protein